MTTGEGEVADKYDINRQRINKFARARNSRGGVCLLYVMPIASRQRVT